MAPRAGFEPATNRLTAGCSTTELPGNRGSHVSGAAYSKPVSALQRSISYFFGAFFARRFLAIVRWRPHISRLAESAEPKTRLQLSSGGVFYFARTDQQTRHERSKPQPSTGTENIGLRPSVHHAALARPQDCDRRGADLRRHSWLPANPGFLDDTAWIAGAFLRVCLGAPPSAQARRVVGTAAAAELTRCVSGNLASLCEGAFCRLDSIWAIAGLLVAGTRKPS